MPHDLDVLIGSYPEKLLVSPDLTHGPATKTIESRVRWLVRFSGCTGVLGECAHECVQRKHRPEVASSLNRRLGMGSTCSRWRPSSPRFRSALTLKSASRCGSEGNEEEKAVRRRVRSVRDKTLPLFTRMVAVELRSPARCKGRPPTDGKRPFAPW